MIEGTIKRWGNSPALRLPVTIMQALNAKVDDVVQLEIQDDKIVVSKIQNKPEFDLSELLSRITPDNLHEPFDWSNSLDKESS